MSEEPKTETAVPPGLLLMIAEYGDQITNHGGNKPEELITELLSERGARLSQTNLPRYLIAFGVYTQLQMLHTLYLEGLLLRPRPYKP